MNSGEKDPKMINLDDYRAPEPTVLPDTFKSLMTLVNQQALQISGQVDRLGDNNNNDLNTEVLSNIEVHLKRIGNLLNRANNTLQS